MKKSKLLLGVLLLSTMSLLPYQNMTAPSIKVLDANDSEETIRKYCREALNATQLNIDTDKVVADFILPAVGPYQVSLSYASSSDALVIEKVSSDNGKISRYRAKVNPKDIDSNVILTMKAYLMNHADIYEEKQIALTVLKKKTAVKEDAESEFEEDFSSYADGMDLGDYHSYTQSGSEAYLATIVTSDDPDLSNVNDLKKGKAVKFVSKTASSDTRYLRKIDLPVSMTPNGAYLEGYFLFLGETNGIGFELMHGSDVVSGINLSSDGVFQDVSGSYQKISSPSLTEGVWTKFRLQFRPKSGFSLLSIYDFKKQEYVICGNDDPLFNPVGGLSSGKNGDVDGFRLVSRKGKNVGYSYLSDLKLHLDADDAIYNPNRSKGIGRIENLKESLFATEDEIDSLSDVDPKTFVLHNRFDDNDVFASSLYTVSTEKQKVSSSLLRITHTFELTQTGEKKKVTQEVYLYSNEAAPEIVSFKAGYVKKDKNDPSKGRIQLEAVVNQNGVTLYYVILKKGSASLSPEQIVSGTGLSDMVDHGSYDVSSRNVSFSSAMLDAAKAYDVYAVLKKDSKISSISSSLDVSTVVNINSCEDFYQMASDVDLSEEHFRLTRDLDFSGFYWDSSNTEFRFRGSLDGEGHRISNLTISSTENRVGIFSYCYGTIENISFENCHVFGEGNVGLIAGNIYGGSYHALSFKDCSAEMEPTLEGTGEGYFGLLSGRCRGSSTSTYTLDISEISLENVSVVCPKYCGLLTGGLESGCNVNIQDVFAQGKVNTEGAAVGLIGRNRTKTKIKNLICFLSIVMAKKEVGVISGHNKEGGSLSVENAILDLQVSSITQPGYMASVIGSHDAATSTYSLKNVSYIKEDYSDFGDFSKDVKAIDGGKQINHPQSEKDWEEKTFIRSFDTNLSFGYDKDRNMPYLHKRKAEELSFAASDFKKYVDMLDMDKPYSNHYALMKAGEILKYLSDEEKNKARDDIQKYGKAYQDYQDFILLMDSISADMEEF